jgi:molybdopterin-containing oxidoreductase family iron-sulfur binding subunit
MKTPTKNLPEPTASSPYWRSVADLEASPEVKAHFDRKVPDHQELFGDATSRRGFLQVMGASLAFAGVAGAGCRWDEDHIVPLAERPEGWVPGVPKKYATAMEVGGVGVGLIATSYDGRPIKLDGNAEAGAAGSSAFIQGAILGMYDPDRSRAVVRRAGGKPTAGGWAEFEDLVAKKVAAGGGAGVRFLTEPSSSPTLAALREAVKAKLPEARWHEYEPLSRDNELAGTRMAFGAPHRSHYKLAGANVVASFDCDLFFEHPDALALGRAFAARRDPDAGAMNRLYAIEANFSLTGGMADHRLPVRAELVKPILLAVEAAVAGGGKIDAAIVAEPAVAKFVAVLAKDLAANRGASLVCVGPRQPADVHAIAARLNAALGNTGTTVAYSAVVERPTHAEDLAALVGDMTAGRVDTLVILGGNPVYDAPVELDFGAALGKVADSVHLSSHVDETSAKCTWHLPRTHFLEAWGDSRAADGTVLLAQPVVQPLFEGRSAIEVVKLFAGLADQSAEALVHQTFASYASAGAALGGWRKALHDGFAAGTGYALATPAVADPASVAVAPLTASQKLGSTGIANGKLEVVFVPSSATWDGRYANNAWLQETPDFLTKLTWDNAALIAPRTAAALGVAHQEVVELTVDGRTIKAAAYVMPGQAPFSVAIALGHGRTRAGHVGGLTDDDVAPRGFDAYRLRTAKGAGQATGLNVKPTGASYLLASTQDHFDLDERGVAATQVRIPELVKESTEVGYRKEPDFTIHGVHTADTATLTVPAVAAKANLNLWDAHKYEGHKWGMAIDLSKCTGCNACMVACQAENNIPVVGKEQVEKNREMHWIRIDRYFKGSPDSPELALQPMPCQQCENAPCEQVCPVGATIHSDEGLNDMVYNRCVGTRYCANNCPYKVRKFNFLRWDWYKELDEARNKVRALLFNPEVTVRSRGVMEKCTYCVQRIQNVKIAAKNKLGDADRGVIRDGAITSACQDACPSDAIVFGDLNDTTSKVRGRHDSKRAYAALAELNTKPRTVYLGRIKNPHPELA